MKSYGNTARVETEREYVFNYDSKTGNSLTITYEVPEEKALASLPVMGSGTSLMSGVILRKATVKPGEGGIASIKLEYGKPDDEEVEEDDTGDTDPGDSEFPEDDEEDVVEQSLDGSVNDEPLLSHPKAQSGINDAHREYLKAVQDGTRLWELVNELNEDGSPKKDKDGQPVMKPLKQLLKNLSDNGKEVLKMLLQGIHSYRSPGATFREARMVRSSAVNLSGLGKIATPADAPTPSGRNWLLVGKSFSRTSSGKKNRWRVETIYELSGASGWNKKLYGN
ncbi:MAG: hypothetical protein IKK62_08850 [Bacteroidaceae bacterium]|nr:hypothetical protein [Bacteroidaceae bacterium]